MAEPANGLGEANLATSGHVNGSAYPPPANSQPVLDGSAETAQAAASVNSSAPNVTSHPYQSANEDLNGGNQSISADEIALYDRQIRLWGVKAQERLRSAKILLIGMKARANEIAKNLVLAGAWALTLLGH